MTISGHEKHSKARFFAFFSILFNLEDLPSTIGAVDINPWNDIEWLDDSFMNVNTSSVANRICPSYQCNISHLLIVIKDSHCSQPKYETFSSIRYTLQFLLRIDGFTDDLCMIIADMTYQSFTLEYFIDIIVNIYNNPSITDQ